MTVKKNEGKKKILTAEEKKAEFKLVMDKAIRRATYGGLSGAAAMGVQVLSLMWLRTTMNHQYKYGGTTFGTIKKLYAEGGVRRFYRGLGPGLLQAPLSRFGDTAANAGVITFLNTYEPTQDWPTSLKTATGSGVACFWRLFLMPIDACKTTLQVEGATGLKQLFTKVGKFGPQVLFHGGLAAVGATFVGHFPWFFTRNKLDEIVPVYTNPFAKFGRNGLIGFCASVVSDCSSNSIRVVKTAKQTAVDSKTYAQTVKTIYAEGGLVGLFGRGLKTRILANGLQGCLFNVLWKFFENALIKGKDLDSDKEKEQKKKSKI